MSEESVKLTVAAAAQAFGLPERSLFRAVEKGHIPSSKRDGVAVLDPADVEAWAARRAVRESAAASLNTPTAAVMPGSLSAAHGSLATGSGNPGSRTPTTLDGDLAATLFSAFERGETPVAIVQQHRIPPPVILSAYAQYQQLKAATAPSPQQARLDVLELDLQCTQGDVLSLLDSYKRLSRCNRPATVVLT